MWFICYPLALNRFLDGFSMLGNTVSIISKMEFQERCVDLLGVKKAAHEVWTPPSIGSLKFNIDGSARGSPGMASIGGVLRNCNGMVLFIFLKWIGVQDSNTDNALWDKEIVIISDSKVAVSWVKNEGLRCIKLVSVIYDICSMLNSWDNISIAFHLRASNSFIDMLAKNGSGRSGNFLVWGDY
ncbi:hypothetical protein Ddye_009895 [Dipteronia dyeriana]|uniref:RNase H type-1 domain-containing protein n=1 Tax=Dipteronia dyeriana TaxID=168575 RepID=A0AAD9XDA7_9ROSI|nr:hypothetical protein Ddye_009895 [Dipteronia dyeriana]